MINEQIIKQNQLASDNSQDDQTLSKAGNLLALYVI